ncbi:putative bifunctional diguanylate cyclase/phosphodiesterase [Ornithinibacillus halotolerans]|nr:EAL domain-containing protein [Ornithinibacillus halotolerans]
MYFVKKNGDIVSQRKKHAILFMIVFMTSYYSWIWIFIDQPWMRAFGSAIFPIIGATISIYWLSRPYSILPPVHRRFILMVNTGLVLFLISNGIWLFFLLTNIFLDFPQTAWIFWVLADVLFLAALIYKLRLLYKSNSMGPFLFNIIIFMIAATTFSIHFLINPIVDISKQYQSSLFLNTLYPILDLAIAFVIINIYYMTRHKKERLTYQFLTLGFFVQIITDTVYAVLLINDKYTYGSVIDPLWILAILFIGYSGLYVEEEEEEKFWIFRSKLVTSVDNGLIFNASVIILTALVLESNNWEWDSLTFGLVISIIFIVIRQIIIIKQNRSLLEELWHSAYHDKLTGLTNRTSFLRDIKDLIKFSKQKKKKFAIFLFDFDRFKNINDTLGHNVGNQVLRECAVQLKKSISEVDRVYRLGGDEFTIILQDKSKESCKRVAESILNHFANPLLFNQYHISIKPSIGISIFPDNGETIEKLMKNADISMYLAKSRGGNQYTFYNSELNNMVERKMMMEHDLERAIQKGQFILHYQPKINLQTRKIVGVEALVRWKHPLLGTVPPTEFIAIAEETGQIVAIGNWVLHTACNQIKKWKQMGYDHLHMAINVSARQFEDKNFISDVKEIIDKTGVHPSDIELEITESVVKNIADSSRILKELDLMGIRASLDDFGTGYSSLSVLKDLLIDAIKIDRSFIQEHTDADIAMMKSIMNIGFNFNLEVIVEGIEHEQQVEALLAISNRTIFGQGYLFSKPASAEEIEKLF